LNHSLARQVARFALIGGSNVVIDFGLYNLLLAVHPSRNPDTLVIYNTIAVIGAIANSYHWNRSWTFRGQRLAEGGGPWRERLLFIAQGVLNVVVNDLVLAAVTVVLNRNDLLSTYLANNLAKVMGVLVASSVSFLAMRYVVFKRWSARGVIRGAPRQPHQPE
jgi:putative flippase GtrA